MHKVLILVTALIVSSLTACGSLRDAGDVIPNALDAMSLMYRPDIQQGNVVTQETMDKVKLGMDKRQVRYALGSPMLVDVFHQDRWDYVYTMGRGSKPKEIARTAMIFENERLVRIDGELQPRPINERPEPKKELLVSVPDYVPENMPLFDRILSFIGLGDKDS